MTTNDQLKETGFVEIETGGNCTALFKSFGTEGKEDYCEFYITCDASIPTQEEWEGTANHDCPVHIGYYPGGYYADEGQTREVHCFDDVVEAMWGYAKIELI